MSQNLVKILGFAGSLRKGSLNRALLRAAFELRPADCEMETFDLEGIPPFNQDMEKGPPNRVVEFKRKINEVDSIFIVTPEYNYSIPGVLKNAIDWASRPFGDNSWQGKPVAVASVSRGMMGGVRAQLHLRHVFVYLNMFPVNGPEVIVTFGPEKFDQDLNLKDENTKKLLRELLQNLVDWTRRLKP